MKEFTIEEFEQIADGYVEEVAARKKISKCEAASIMLEGLRFVEEMIPSRPDLQSLFRAVDTEVIRYLREYTCRVCVRE